MMTKQEIARSTFEMMMNELSDEKKNTLKKALERNAILTSSYSMGFAHLWVYHEGFRIELTGTRCSFSAYAKDNDGELEFTRKPNENKLHLIWETDVLLNGYCETDFEKWAR